MIGTFPKQISNYNELEGTPKNLSDFVNDLPELIEFATYEDIPLAEGWYSCSLPALKTSLTNLENHEKILLTDLETASTLINVKRSKIKKGGFGNPFIYRDEFYISTGLYLGYCFREQELNDITIILSDEVLNVYYQDNPNSYSIRYINPSSGSSNKILTAYIEKSLNEFDISEEGTLVIPYILSLSGSFQIIESEIFLGDNHISDYKIGVFSNENNNVKVGIIDFSGQIKKAIGTGVLRIYMTYHLDYRYSTMSSIKKNNESNILLLEQSVPVHADAMRGTFNEFYSQFTGIFYDYNSIEFPEFTDYNISPNFNKPINKYDIDLVFSAGDGVGILKSFSPERRYSVLPVGSNNLIRQDLTDAIDKFPPNYIAVTSRAETDNDGTDPLGTSYGFGTEFNEPTLSADLTGQGLTDWPGSQEHQQSPATAIVAAKLKKIKDETGAPWDIVREAARQTASNAGSYNIYRGFGVIDVNAAIAAIPAMLNARSLELAEYFEATSKFPKELKYQDKGDNTPVVKRDIENYNDFLRLSIPYTSPAQTVKGSIIFENLARFTFGSSFQLWSTGSEGRITLLSHDLKIRDGSNERFSFERSTGTFKANKFQLNDLNTAPASSTAPGTKGDIRITADYIYVCVAANTWKRTALSTW